MNCPHCGKVVIAQLYKDDGVRGNGRPVESAPASGDLGSLLEEIQDELLSGAVAKFVSDTRERYEKYGARTKMSDKQLAWLRRIAAGETGNDNEW